jgi:hypothetical protein
MAQQLEPDHIGRIGESEFATLCAKAGLICNKSTIDYMGWDFFVEFPVSAPGQAASAPLDQRPTTAARIQLKSTVIQAGHRVRLSLSAIDRLAKDPRPALIVVFRLRGDGELQCGYVVHLIGGELAKVLRRLRLAESRKDYDINHTEISYDYEKTGSRFEPTPQDLRAALNAACGDDPAEYTIEKQRQLAELGYEDGRFEAIGNVHLDGPEHLANVLLGLTPMKPSNLRFFDKRFGIRLPYQGTLFDHIGDIQVTPPSLGPCQVSIRGPGLGRAARFDAEMFIGLPTSQGTVMLVRSTNFVIKTTSQGMTLETLGSIDDMLLTLEEWAEFLRAMKLLASRLSSLTISGNSRMPSVTLPVNQEVTGPYLEELPRISEFADGWLQLLSSAGMRSKARFKFDRFWEANEAAMAVDILLNPKPVAHFDFSVMKPKPTADLPEGLYFNSAEFTDTALTYSARVFIEEFDDPTWRFRSVRFEALDVRPKVEDLEEYGIDQATALSLDWIIDPKNTPVQLNASDAVD